MHNKEIERKFIVDMEKIYSNRFAIKNKYEIEQNYLSIGNEEVRIRKKSKLFDGIPADKFTLTVKKGKGLEREEIEITIEKDTFETLAANIDEIPITKTREVYEMDGAVFELDRYRLPSIPHIAEIEFGSVEEAQSFVPPEWVIKEVTEDTNYKNQSLWKKINNINN